MGRGEIKICEFRDADASDGFGVGKLNAENSIIKSLVYYGVKIR